MYESDNKSIGCSELLVLILIVISLCVILPYFVTKTPQVGDILEVRYVMTPELFTLVERKDVTGIQFSNDGKYLVTGGLDHSVQVHELPSTMKIRGITYDGPVSDIALNSSRNWIASGVNVSPGRGIISIWDFEANEEILTLEEDYLINSVAVSPDGSSVIAGEGRFILSVVVRYAAYHRPSGKIGYWTLPSGYEDIDREFSSNNSATSVAFSQEGDFIAAATWDYLASAISLNTYQDTDIQSFLSGIKKYEKKAFRHYGNPDLEKINPLGNYSGHECLRDL